MMSRAHVRLFVFVFVVVSVAFYAGFSPALAQNRYDESELTDRFYISLGGYSQNDIKTTLRLDAKTPSGAIAAGTVVVLESLFDLDDRVYTARIDGWYRINKRHRINGTYWRTNREGVSTYNGSETIDLGNISINPGDNVSFDDTSQLLAVSWSYSFINTKKYEAWLGAGLNFQTVKMSIGVNVGGGSTQFDEEARGTVPVPTINFGGRYNFGKRWRILLQQEFFGIKIGDFSGKRENTRVLAEVNIIPKFGLGAGFERQSFEVQAEGDDFAGELDRGYTAFALYLKGQF